MYRSVLTEVKADQVVALPVFSPRDWRTTPLVNKGSKITHTVLSRLLDYGIRSLWIEHEQTDFLIDKINPDTQFALREFTGEVAKFWGLCQSQLERINLRHQSQSQFFFNAPQLQKLIKDLINVLSRDKERIAAIGALQRQANSGIDRIVLRTLLSLCLALEMESEIYLEKIEKMRKYRRNLSLQDYRSAKDLTSLGVGALLMDVHRLPDIVCKESEKDDTNLLDHRKKYITSKIEQFSDTVAKLMVRLRQQNYDGSGQPKAEHEDASGQKENRGLKGMEIHLVGRMSRLSDVFVDFLLQKNSWIQALSMTQDQASISVDPILVEAFLQMVPPFPLGSQVVLNTGELGIVVAQNQDMPCRPVVYKIKSKEESEPTVDLAKMPVTTHFIETTLDAPSVSCMDYFYSNISAPAM